MDEDSFIRSFEDCPNVQIFSSREVVEQMKSIQEIISDANKDWNKRVDAVSDYNFISYIIIKPLALDNSYGRSTVWK